MSDKLQKPLFGQTLITWPSLITESQDDAKFDNYFKKGSFPVNIEPILKD